MQKTIVVAAFFGIGRSTFIENHKRHKILNIENTLSPDGFQEALVKVRKAVSRNVKYVFIPLNEEFLKVLDDAGISFYMMMPEKSRKTEIIQSYFNNAVFDDQRDEIEVKREIGEIQSNWDGLYRAAQSYATQIGIKILFLNKGEYLTSGMKFIEELEKENV